MGNYLGSNDSAGWIKVLGYFPVEFPACRFLDGLLLKHVFCNYLRCLRSTAVYTWAMGFEEAAFFEYKPVA